MDASVIETRELSYRFGNQQVLDKVSLQVSKGSIYGFLGPNGAGKTTTIKLLLNLLKSSDKNISLFNQELSGNRINILSKVGSLIEQPAIYGHLTGRENLAVRASLLRVKSTRVGEMLRVTDIAAAADKKAAQYSLGMKQRLGIALALLPDPELLILDEPTNGLDPNGIIEIRKLLIHLTREQNKTIFVSSHMLSEVEKTATHVGIINAGKMVFQGSVADLQKLGNEHILIEADDVVNAANTLLNQGYAAEILQDQLVVPFTSNQQMGAINTLLVSNGYIVFSIQKSRKDLEHLFLSLTRTS